MKLLYHRLPEMTEDGVGHIMISTDGDDDQGTRPTSPCCISMDWNTGIRFRGMDLFRKHTTLFPRFPLTPSLTPVGW